MFRIAKMEVGQTAPMEHMIANEAVVYGEALTLATGKVAKCAATAKPDYIAVGAAAKSGDSVPVIKVQSYMQFETTITADGASLHLGDKVTLDSTALQVTATTGSGVATILGMDGTAIGSTVTVRF